MKFGECLASVAFEFSISTTELLEILADSSKVKKASKNYDFSDAEQVLFSACHKNSIKVVKFLVQFGGIEPDNDCLEISLVSEINPIEKAKFLVSKFNLELSEDSFSDAVMFGNADVVKYLLKSSPPIGEDVFISAITYGYIDIVEMILKKSRISISRNMIYTAALQKQTPMLKWLLKKGKFSKQELNEIRVELEADLEQIKNLDPKYSKPVYNYSNIYKNF